MILTGSAAPGGSTTQVQYNSAGAFAGDSNFTWSASTGVALGKPITITSGTVTVSTPLLDATQTWNDGAVTFTGMKLNVTNSASAAASLLFDLQVAGTTRFKVSPTLGITVTSTDGAGQVLALTSAYGTTNMTRGGSDLSISSGLTVNGGVIEINLSGGQRVLLYSDATDVLAQRNGSTGQEFRPYGYHSSATSRAYGVVKSAVGAVTLSGATSATTNIIPVGSFVIGVAVTITTTITGASGFQVGDGSDADRWGDITGTAVGTDSDNTDSTANPTGYFAAASAVTLTAKTSNFTGGVAQVVVFYLSTGAD